MFFRRDSNKILIDLKICKLSFKMNRDYFLTANKIVLVDDETGKERPVRFVKGLKIRFEGKNSVVRVHNSNKFYNCEISIADDCVVDIAKSKYWIQKLRIVLTNKCNVKIGENFSCFKTEIFSNDEVGKNVHIGDNCMFSRDIVIRTSDGHKIYGIDDNKTINFGEDVFIGNHVWCGMNSLILKGSQIPDNSVIGACSLVNKKFSDKNVIIAGQPAKVIKTSVNWDRKHPNSEVPIEHYEESIK